MNRSVLVVVLSLVVALASGSLLQGCKKAPAPAGKKTKTTEPGEKNRLAYLAKDDPSIKVDALGPRKWKVIDIHEHAKGEVEAKQLLKAMDAFGIQRTALMGSTDYTLTLNDDYGFEGFKKNNEALIEVKKKWPDRFSAFITFDPCDVNEDLLALVKDYVSRGADGVKLYLGHGAKTKKFAFHCMGIDDPKLEPFFAWAEEVSLPILMHVNLEKYWDETMRVLEKHPYLRVALPHYGLHKNTEARLKRLAFLLERYPYVFTDVSFGFYTFQIEGFEALSKNRSRSRNFFNTHSTKILYGSDMVLEPGKDEPYIMNTLRSYFQFLEMEKWRLFLVPTKTMHGMGLPDATLKAIYEDAPKAFLILDDKGLTPDRTKNPKVEVPRRVLPPLVPSMIPQLTKDPAATGEPEH